MQTNEANDFVYDLLLIEFGFDDRVDDDWWTPEMDQLHNQMTFALDQGRDGNWDLARECVKNLRSQERNDMAGRYEEYVDVLKIECKQQAERFTRERETEREARKEVQLNLFEGVT